jgi:protein-tyrosine phosphatase
MLTGAPNFRSLGGIPVSGGAVREGVLFRSDAFANLYPEDRRRLAAIGLRTVVDLRRERERAEEPSDLPLAPGARTIARSVTDAVASGAGSDYFAQLRAQPDAAGAEAVMCDLYTQLPHAMHTLLGDVLTILADESAAPAVIHCAAGKDRTGMFCAALLHALGATREAIIADYVVTDGRYPPSRMATVGRLVSQAIGLADTREVSAVLIGAKASYITAALAEIDHFWGSFDGYLASAGVDSALCARLREFYVVAAD